jgi:uncharacterized protein YndB with AHSA1/START domain
MKMVHSREFDAPRRLVYAAYTTSDLVKRWWGGKRGQVTECEIGLHLGGQWRYVLIARGQLRLHSTANTANERIVSTEIYEGARRTSDRDRHIHRDQRAYNSCDPRMPHQ